jgi:hypothetical protein
MPCSHLASFQPDLASCAAYLSSRRAFFNPFSSSFQPQRCCGFVLRLIASLLRLEQAGTDILNDFYERGFEGLNPAVRVFVEDRLLTASGFRSTVPLEFG